MEKYVLKKAEIDQFAGIDKTHFLNPNACRKNKSLGDLTGLTNLGFHIIEVPPGGDSTEYHCHRFEDEATYILAGLAEVTIGEEVVTVEPGDFIGYRANGLPHTMKNIGEETLVCIVVGARLTHEVVDYPHQGKRLYVDKNQPWDLVAIDHVSHPTPGKKV